MSNARNYLLLLLYLLLINFVITPISSADESVEKDVNRSEKEIEELKEIVENLKQRLKSLEPTEPVNIQDPPWGELPFPSQMVSISEVINKGTKIPFEVTVNKPDYKRPAYKKHWHSTSGRWSYVPNRIHYALHRNIGLSIPMFQDEEALDMYIVAFQTQLTNVYTKGNQVVVVGNPKRNGVQVITITTRDIHPTNKEEKILIHLATQEGHEIDYSLISYVPPDFWAK